jgi:hypothetical protein
MTAVTHADRREDSDQGPPDSDRMPGRPRRRYLNRWSAALIALITCALGFYAGVRIEKGQVNGSASSSPTASAFAARARALAAGSGGGTGASGSAAARGGTGGPGGSGAPGGFGGGGASFGTVSSVRGSSIYVTDGSGNTVKVKLSSATKISKSLPVSRKSLRPGDTVVIQGVKNSSGALVAASLTDSGAGSGLFGGNAGSGSGGSGGSGSGAGPGSTSGVGSLFSSGGGG